MKRIAIAAIAALVAMVAATSALAAGPTVNTYKASYSFTGSKGTAGKPAPLSFEQTFAVAPVTAGDRSGLLHEIDSSITGAKFDPSGFPTCTAAQINAASNDTACPKKALLATGSIQATLGSATDFTQAGAACDPLLHVWNAGHHKMTYFFVESASHQCLGGQLHTGQVGAWTGTYKQKGSVLTTLDPIPNTVDYPLGLSGGTVGSLSYEKLHWIYQSMGTKHDLESTGCSGSKRSYTFAFTASLPSVANETVNTKGSASCG